MCTNLTLFSVHIRKKKLKDNLINNTAILWEEQAAYPGVLDVTRTWVSSYQTYANLQNIIQNNLLPE